MSPLIQSPSCKLTLLLALTCLGPIAAGVAAESAASQNSDAIEEIVVTATKQAENLSKVPISISAYTQEFMDERGIKSIGDIVAQTPGLDLRDQGSNGTGDRISIRGIDSNTGSATTGVYIDDTPIQARANPVNLAGTVFPQVFDLERVEVLRGPQGTLFGAGAEGGVVRFITPQPSLEKFSTYARAEIGMTRGGDASYEAGGAFGGPLIPGTLGLRISGWMRHDGGWVDRTAWETQQNFDHVNSTDGGTGRLALLWKPTDRLSLTPAVLFQATHTNDSGNYWLDPSNPSYDYSNPAARAFRNGYQLRQPSTEHFVQPSLKIEADLGAMTLTAITSYFHRSESNVTDVTNTDIPGTIGITGPNGENNVFPSVSSGALVTDAFNGATWQNIFTQELRLASNDPVAKLRWVGGLFFQNSRLRDTQLAPNPQLPTLLQEQSGVTPFNPLPVDLDSFYYNFDPALGEVCHPNPGPCSGLYQGIYEYVGDEHSRDQQIALFGNLNYSFTDQWILNTGLRLEHTQSSFVSVENGPVNNGPSASGGAVNANPVTPKLGISYQRDPDHLYYANVAKGYRPGGGNSHVPYSCNSDLQASGLADTPLQYGSDSTWSYEIGSKNKENGGRLSIDASAFLIDWRKVQWYYFLPDCGYGFVINEGRAESKGFDVDINARLTEALRAELSVGYTHATFLDSDIRNGAVIVAKGQTLGQTPWTISASLEYRTHTASGAELYVRAVNDFESRNSGPYNFQNPGYAFYDQALIDRGLNPSIDQLDVRVGRAWDGIDLSVFVNNLLDAAPRDNLMQPGPGPAPGHLGGSELFTNSTIRPRMIGLTATMKL